MNKSNLTQSGYPLFKLLAIAAVLVGVMPLAVMADSTPQHFNIPAQPLDNALTELADSANLKLVYPVETVKNQQSHPVSGNYLPQQALQKLLVGTGITAHSSANGAIMLAKADNTANKKEAINPASNSGATTLKTVTVHGEVNSPNSETESPSLTTPSIAESKAKLNRVPGGTTVIEGKRIKEGISLSVSDTLATAPGVYVGDISAGATGGSRISIRGSDANSFISPIKGIKVLRNGMPLTHANGTFDTEQFNLYAIDHIDVYRGASALEYGGSNLGGAINIITPTGYTASPLKIGMNFGTNGYVHPIISAGKAFDNGFDAYGSFSYLDTNTTREHNDQTQYLGHGNLGYRWNENQETRLYFDIQKHDFLWPGSLTKQQIAQNPRQNSNDWSLPQGIKTYRVDLKHSIKLDDTDRFDIGAYYSNNKYVYDYVGSVNHDTWEDVGFNWRHEINGNLFGMKNKLIWGGLTQWQFIYDGNYEEVNRSKGALQTAERDVWTNVEAYLEDQLSLTNTFTLVAGLQLNYREVDYKRTFGYVADETRPSNSANQDFFTANPKLGFTWQATKEGQIYGNLSRSSEPPPISDLANVYLDPSLELQTASTVEIGTRGQTERLKWDFAFYQAWLNNEYLIIGDPKNPNNFSAANANSTTLHSGIELALETNIPLNLVSSGDEIRLFGNYTWNNFRFDNDKVLGSNRIPGIPEHVARLEALYKHPSGFYVGPNAQIVSSNWVDFNNTLSANPYALLGARIGWDDGKHWKLFVDGRNLTNEYYASSVWVMGNANGDDLAQFNPGATRSVFGGIEYRY
jgi:iron complex outermembrane recepter protein